ncbi:hypothetical protein WAI453_004755 [Rhynchosporium graminicola]
MVALEAEKQDFRTLITPDLLCLLLPQISSYNTETSVSFLGNWNSSYNKSTNTPVLEAAHELLQAVTDGLLRNTPTLPFLVQASRALLQQLQQHSHDASCLSRTTTSDLLRVIHRPLRR